MMHTIENAPNISFTLHRRMFNLAVFGITHALVDAACVAVVFHLMGKQGTRLELLAMFVLAYDSLAFSAQFLFGAIFDSINRPVMSSILGCLLVISSIFTLSWPIIAILFAGIGNALFHVGGGIVTLRMHPGKATDAGIFVAPGTLGVLAGTLVGKGGHFTAQPFLTLLAVACILLLIVKCPPKIQDREHISKTNKAEIILVLLLMSVAVRGLIGVALNFPWKTELSLTVSLTFAVFFGKALGGILADWLGFLKVAVGALLIAAPILTFGNNNPYLSMLGIFLFNMTMPITLSAAADLLPGSEGFAFGLTTFALFLGLIPAFIGVEFISTKLSIILSILLSAGTLWWSLAIYGKEKDNLRNAGNGKPFLVDLIKSKL